MPLKSKDKRLRDRRQSFSSDLKSRYWQQIRTTILHRKNHVSEGAERTENGNRVHPAHFASAQFPTMTRSQVLHARRHFLLQGLHSFFM